MFLWMLFPLSFVAVTHALQVVERVEGEDVTLVPEFSGEAEEILWKIQEDKLVELVGGRLPHYYQLEGRAEAQLPTGNLTIRRLTGNDSNRYTAEILIGSTYTYSAHELRVLPPRPTVRYVIGQEGVNLFCVSPVSVSFVWRDGGGNVLAETANFTASIEKLRNKTDVTCVVSNSHYSNNRTLQLDLPPEGGESSGGHTAVWVPILVVMLLVIVVGVSGLAYIYRDSIRSWSSGFSAVPRDPVQLERTKTITPEEPFCDGNDGQAQHG
ncbi:uncharacterized protein LOC128475372 [Spea bombifrons]|uniref:uncharacterized protein LOC128475372 n=1 Tax=Spea bombifrons TaxID=233779 RepID=UPI00234B5781|nr:uncharacterized protein LOC128475372 [Spea bombifrons]